VRFGSAVQTLDYYPYGATRISTNVGGANSQRQFIGQFSDASGLSYLNARYYNPSQGQFISEDPSFLAVGDPTKLRQVTGLDHGSEKAYAGVIAQEVQEVMPEAVIRARHGYLIVLYDKLGLRLQTYDRWIASGARMPVVSPNRADVSGHVFSQDWQQRATYPWSRTVPPKHDGAAPVLAHEVK
jgi:RHS repeat-associated protein